MIVYRFMSNDEFLKYRSGKVLKNKTNHNKINHRKTNSIGFCFFDINDYDPEEAMHFLSGIVSFDICAVFETDKKLNKTYGVYAEPIKRDGNILSMLTRLYNNWNNSFTADEYCTSEYDKRSFKLLKYSKDIWNQWNPAEIQDDLKWEECVNELQTT